MITGAGFVFKAIRPEFMVLHPVPLSTNHDFCFHNDLPDGAWLDAPDILAAGSHYNYHDGPMPSVAVRP